MLGCLEMSVQACIDKYIEIMVYVFKNSRHSAVDMRGNIAAKYEQHRLRERILGVIGESSVVGDIAPEDVLMRRRDRAASCRV